MSIDLPKQPIYKAIFTDLDGTAIPNGPNGLPSQKVIDAMVKAQSKAYVSVATGRPFEMCDHILDRLEVKNLCVVNGGSVIVNPATNEVVWEQIMPPETMQKVLEACAPYQFIEVNDSRSIKRSMKEPLLTGSNRMVVLLSADEAESDRVISVLKQVPEINVLKVHSWVQSGWDLHISHIGASKRHALEVLLGMLNIEAHEVIGVGDSQNDLPLFEAVGLKVAMGNATQALKDKADYIAPTVDEDGLAHVIEKFILNV